MTSSFSLTRGLRWRRPRPGGRGILAVLLVAATVAAVAVVRNPDGLMHNGSAAVLGKVARSALTPDLSGRFLLTAAEATVLTIAYATAGMSLAVLLGLPGAALLAGHRNRTRWARLARTGPLRALLGTLRSIHELVWALLLVTVLGLTPLAGILAIAVPYGATIARVIGERLQDVPAPPLEALRSAGADNVQVLLFGQAPMAAADCAAYLWYRYECAVRSAAVLSFVGLGGIGYRIQVALADLAFDQVWTLVAFLVLLIAGMDRLSARHRAHLVDA